MFKLSMNAMERHKLVIEELEHRRQVSVGELAKLADCSEMTIRRDLEHLEEQGVLRRVHGGAESLLLRAVEAPYAVRALTAREAKERIGKVTAALLGDGETVIIDTGTTALEVARALSGRQMTVAALSLHAIQVLAGDGTIRLLVPGGLVRPGELALNGDQTERMFVDFRFDTLILGCCGIDADNGATAYDLDDVRVKRAARRSAKRTIAVATADKLGRVTFGHICPAEQIDVLVTDADQGAESVHRLQETGINVITA
jgi:DeoR/GlpR family transcriptional regulator of sugar metabolism